jgi:hypothetical protein
MGMKSPELRALWSLIGRERTGFDNRAIVLAFNPDWDAQRWRVSDMCCFPTIEATGRFSNRQWAPLTVNIARPAFFNPNDFDFAQATWREVHSPLTDRHLVLPL